MAMTIESLADRHSKYSLLLIMIRISFLTLTCGTLGISSLPKILFICWRDASHTLLNCSPSKRQARQLDEKGHFDMKLFYRSKGDPTAFSKVMRFFRNIFHILDCMEPIATGLFCAASLAALIFGVFPLIPTSNRDVWYGVCVGVVCGFHLAMLISCFWRALHFWIRRIHRESRDNA